MARRGLNEYNTSIKMRDIIERLVDARIKAARPPYRYATVVSIDRVARKCSVLYTGSPEPVTVNMGSLQPASAGQTVRIEGIGTDRFVADVIGQPYVEGYVQLGSNAGVNVNPVPRIVLGPNGDTEPYIMIYREHPTLGTAGAYLYATRGSNNLPMAGIIARTLANMARLAIRGDGQAYVSTYADSPTVSSTRPLPFAMAVGDIEVDLLGNGSTDSYSISYPSGRFTQVPYVFINTQGTVPRRTFGASGNSTSGFTLRTANYSGANSGAQRIHWVALQLEV